VQDAAIRAIREGKHGYTPSAGIDPLREAAAKYMAGMRGGVPIRAEDVVVGAGAKPFIAYAILSVTDHGSGDEVIYPNPGFPIYESQIVACGASRSRSTCTRAGTSLSTRPSSERLITRENEAADPQLSAEPDRRAARQGRARADRRDPAQAPAGLGLRRRDLLAALLRG
jgi:aspartate/methionine/tyrosine aminotransferase